MNIPNLSYNKLIETTRELFGMPTDSTYYFFQQLIAELQKNVGQEGFVIPTLSSAAGSITPPAAGGQIGAISADSQNGTLIYDSNTDKLRVRLSDGTFHDIVTL